MLETLLSVITAPSLAFLPALLLYPLLAIAVTRLLNPGRRYGEVPFAIVNLLGAFFLCALACQAALKANYPGAATLEAGVVSFAAYLVFVLAAYALLKRSKKIGGAWITAALWTPILILVCIKYLPIYGMLHLSPGAARLIPNPALVFVGLSYLSFRLTYLVQEVQNDVVPMPNVWDYLSFAFFVPTMTIGPISPYRLFIGSLRTPDRTATPIGVSLQRIAVGLAKYVFFSTLLSQLCYRSLLLDGHPHAKIDLVVAILVYPLYLYCNFSGLCDVVIGVAGLMGIAVMENFDRPFSSRNFQVFWSRWHISLSTFMRDMMFTPLVKFLAARFGPKNINHAVAIAIISVFLVIGVWHGAGAHFALFGLSQGLGVAAVHYSTIFMKKRLGKKGFIAYQNNRVIYAAACACTYLYFALTMILFANTLDDIAKIISVLT